MSADMDKSDKDFFFRIFDNIEKRLDSIVNHANKTCDEVDEIKKDNLVQFPKINTAILDLKKELTTHLENNKNRDIKREKQKWTKHIHTREWIMVGIAIVTTYAIFK